MTDTTCTCPYGIRSLGRLHGVNMGRGRVRLTTTPGCPEHDSCHGYTKEHRRMLARSQPTCDGGIVGYLSDWTEAENAAAAAHLAHPDCNGTLECPAADHLLDCRRFRAERAMSRAEGSCD